MGELIPAPSLHPVTQPSLMTESLTLVPYGQHTLAIPTSMVTPQLLAHLASMSAADVAQKKMAKPTMTDTTDASHATAAPPGDHTTRLAQLGMELNTLLNDEQRTKLNTLHRTARDACDPHVAAEAKQQFWDVWYAAAPRAQVEELRALMNRCEEASPTPASATPATSTDVVCKSHSGVSTTARFHSSDDERDTAAGRKRKLAADEAALQQMQGKIARLERALASVVPLA